MLKKVIHRWQHYQKMMPAGAGALLLIQMSSILSFSVLYSSLLLYATKTLHLTDQIATEITGTFLALNYFLHLVGGTIGGRFLSYRCLFIISMLAQVLGCALLAVNEIQSFMWGLATFLSGCGLNITCINCMLTQLFSPEDKNRETAFIWNYGGQNLGIFIGFMMAGYFDLIDAYRPLFLFSALGNVVAILLMLKSWRLLSDRNTIFSSSQSKQKTKMITGLLLIILLTFFLRYLLMHTDFCNKVIIFITITMCIYLINLAFRQRKAVERNKIFAYLILAVAAIIFWTLILIGPMALNLFVERNVDRHLYGVSLAPEWILNITNFVTILGAPVIGLLFSKLRTYGINITIGGQFVSGLLLIGLSFIILPIGIYFSNSQHFTHLNWIVISFSLQGVADLFISPVGYAMVGQLAPKESRGMMMGTWLMFGGITGVLANYISKYAVAANTSIASVATNASYSQTFMVIGLVALGAGGLLIILLPFIDHLTQERKLLSTEMIPAINTTNKI